MPMFLKLLVACLICIGLVTAIVFAVKWLL